MAELVVCGNTCGHNHESPNGPTGCCTKHGPYMYCCPECQAEWESKRPEEKDDE